MASRWRGLSEIPEVCVREVEAGGPPQAAHCRLLTPFIMLSLLSP